MERREYNGWTNYETWNLALWLDNGGEADYYHGRALEIMESNEGDVDVSTRELAGEIESAARDNAPDLDGFAGDMLSAALSEVNFEEIAAHYVADCGYEAPEPEEEEDRPPIDADDK